MPELAIDHLTALDLPPAAFHRAAARAGFSSVSLRTIHITGGEPGWAGERLDTAALARAIAGSGVRVHAIEAVAITPTLTSELDALVPLLEEGAEVGARLLYSFSDDPDADRCADTLAALAETAAPFGLRTVIEPMPYRAVATLAQASEIVARVPGAGLIVDTLHATRGGTTPAELATLPAEQLAVLQLCDAPAEAPTAQPASGLHPLLNEARFERRLPGAGELPLADFAGAMPSGSLVTIEAPARDTGADAEQRLRAAHRAALAALGTPHLDGGAA